MDIHFRLESKTNGSTTDWTTLPLTHSGKLWTRTLQPETDIPGYNSNVNPWWFQFYFVATSNKGVQATSPTNGNSVTLMWCPID